MDNPLITYLQLFRPIPEKDRSMIVSSFEARIAKEGDYLFKGGNICREMFFIGKGVLRIVVMNDMGIEVTHYFLNENQFCTILGSFNNGVPADESIQAACDAEVLAITRTGLLTLYEKIPYLKELIDQITQQRLLDKIQIRNAYLGLDSSARYELFLMRQPDIALRVPLRDIASYLEITPQSLSRIRKNIH
jgi:CRP/FNR family transcriptional regulator, anaerobic regulatory protein